MARAICHGHDIVLSNKRKPLGWLAASPAGSLFRFVREILLAPGRIIARRRASVQSISGSLLAFGLAVAYAGLKFAGEVTTFVSPRFVRNRVRHELLPLLDDIAGRDLVPLLVRQADLLREEADLLDALAG